MKSLNLTKFVWNMLSGLTALALAAGMAFAPAASAFADNGTPPAPGGGKEKRAEFLQKAYQREQKWLETQQNHLDRANEAAARVQDWIAKLNEKGKDTSALQAALATFQAQLAAAQSAHDTAVSVLSAQAGLDANGQVTDMQQARQTVKDAHQSLRDAHRELRQAVHDLHRAIRAWRQANGGSEAETPEAEVTAAQP